MEMVLKTLKLCAIAILIKQAYGFCDHVIIIWRVVLHDQLVLLSFLIELELFLWINFCVLEFEVAVIE